MSFQTDYRIGLFKQADQHDLHRELSVSIQSDAAREQYIKIHHSFKNDISLNLLEFLTLYRCGQREYQLLEYPNGLHYINCIEDLAKIGIENNETYWKDSKFLQYFDLIKITNQNPLNELIKQLNFMIKILSDQWSKIDNDKVQTILNIDFDRNYHQSYEENGYRFSQAIETEIDYGYQEAETIALDILVFILYAIRYIQQHPQAELYFTVGSSDIFGCGLEVYNFFENEFNQVS